MPAIQWTDEEIANAGVCSCRCGTSFVSPAKVIPWGSGQKLVSKKKCSGCKRDDTVQRVQYPNSTVVVR